MEYKELIHDLKEILPEKIPYGELVGAPSNCVLYGPMVYENKEDYLIDQSIQAIEELIERTEKAEKERDEALKLIDWIYYEACVSVEHDMRQYLDWLKDKIEEWRKNKEE